MVRALWCCCLLFAAGCVSRARVEHSSPGIAADPEILVAARDVHFDYMGQLRRAERGDRQALLALIQFTPRISYSAAGYEQQGDILLEVRDRVGKHVFESVMADASADAQEATKLTLEVAEENRKLIR